MSTFTCSQIYFYLYLCLQIKFKKKETQIHEALWWIPKPYGKTAYALKANVLWFIRTHFQRSKNKNPHRLWTLKGDFFSQQLNSSNGGPFWLQLVLYIKNITFLVEVIISLIPEFSLFNKKFILPSFEMYK